MIVLTFIGSSPAGARETVQVKPLAVENKVKELKPISVSQHPVIAELAKTEQPSYERVFCGSPKQRNWKNSDAKNIAIGRRLAAERGWTGSQFDALKELWSCESSWTTQSDNTEGSGAYGIPQSLPASKMSSEGADYLTNPETQIRWGLGYIAKRFGSPQAALNWHYEHNWY